MVCPVRSPAALPSVIMARANQKRPDVHWLSSSQPSHALPKLPTTLRRRCTVIPQRLTISFYLFILCVRVCVCVGIRLPPPPARALDRFSPLTWRLSALLSGGMNRLDRQYNQNHPPLKVLPFVPPTSFASLFFLNSSVVLFGSSLA